ncbi:hypothetical protein PIB30_083720, partial [Stylosanthes scabra]|nr:hypothetical protein [Stylosanthes scabra]
QPRRRGRCNRSSGNHRRDKNGSAEALTAAQHGHPSSFTAMAAAMASTSFVAFFQDIHPYLSLYL